MNHEMKLNAEAFEQIGSGVKDLEVRLYDVKRRAINVGDTITFLRLPNLEVQISKTVLGYVVFGDFLTLFSNVGGIRAGWKTTDTPEKMAEDMKLYYPLEDQKKYGVMGIFLA